MNKCDSVYKHVELMYQNYYSPVCKIEGCYIALQYYEFYTLSKFAVTIHQNLITVPGTCQLTSHPRKSLLGMLN